MLCEHCSEPKHLTEITKCINTYECKRCRSSWSCYSTICECDYEYVKTTVYECDACNNRKCIGCGMQCINKYCIKCLSKQAFNKSWKTLSPKDKLKLYGVIKLKVLAKNKKVKGYSKYKKQQLIDILSPLVVKSDFPIKKIHS